MICSGISGPVKQQLGFTCDFCVLVTFSFVYCSFVVLFTYELTGITEKMSEN